MNWRLRGILALTVCGTLAMLASTRASEDAQATPPADPLAPLLARIEKLERRIDVLESRQQAIQQSHHVFATSDDWLPPTPVPASNPNQPQFGIVYQLKRLVPEAPSDKKTAGKVRSGGIEITR